MTDDTAGLLAGHEGDVATPARKAKSRKAWGWRASDRRVVVRHSAWVRVTHWIWVAALTILFMSGLQIFNAHPSLNFGNTTTFDSAATGPHRLLLDIDSKGEKGVTSILGHTFETTGVLGYSQTPNGPDAVAFPGWLTIPATRDLATARHWHFLFAWVLVVNAAIYLLYGLFSGHIFRDLIPRLREWRTIPHDIRDHLALRFSHGPDAPQYNILQKLAYAFILFVVMPVLVAAGLELSPGIDAVAPWLRDAFGGRQSARTVHFILAWTLVGFVVVHVVMVVLSGLFNNLRSMITGRFVFKRVPSDEV